MFVSSGNAELTPILTYLQHIFLACTLSLQHAWRAHRACTGYTQCVFNTCHCVCELGKCRIDTHIDIFTTYISSVHAQPPACLESTQSVHRVHTPNVFLTHAIVFVSSGNAELTPILTYLQHIFLACTLSLQRAWRAHRACTGC